MRLISGVELRNDEYPPKITDAPGRARQATSLLRPPCKYARCRFQTLQLFGGSCSGRR